uniref:Uncharacterized protein n=1 Tax=Myoviridae sp. ctuIn11 TaxID=2827715 RepID=A0A8S5SHI1_9CAUD|nr:MAG TPA: hypothetical protein [Myoviridae sp. ctuIn11]
MNEERKRVCCNCGNCIRYPTKDGIRCRCAIDDHYIDYLQCFEHWCRRWKRDRTWDGVKAWADMPKYKGGDGDA